MGTSRLKFSSTLSCEGRSRRKGKKGILRVKARDRPTCTLCPQTKDDSKSKRATGESFGLLSDMTELNCHPGYRIIVPNRFYSFNL